MIDSGLPIGPYALTKANVDLVVQGIGPGAYALGRRNVHGGLNVEYVGRSDADLHARLCAHASNANYADFRCLFTSTAKAAFEKECHLFHDFGGTAQLDNSIHPDRPAGTGWVCPRCTLLG